VDFRWGVGIELGEDYLALVCLKQAFFQVKLVDYLVVDSLPYGSESERDRAIAKALTEFARKKRHRLENVTVCLPRRRAAISYMDLPEVARENLEQVIEFEFERFFPFKKETCYFSHRICSSQGPRGQIRVQVVAVQREFVQRILNILQGVKLRLMAIEPSSFALGSYIRFASKNEPPDCLILTVRSGETNLDLWQESDLAYSRTLSLNSLNGDLTHQIQKEVFATKERFGVEETFYCGVLPQRDLGAIPSMSTLGIRGPVANRVPTESLPYVLPACGAALRGLGRGMTDMNLLPQALRTESARLITTTSYVLLTLLLLCGLAWGGSLIFRQQEYIRDLERRIIAVSPDVESLKKLDLEVEALQTEIQNLRGPVTQSPKKLTLLKELTQIIPKETYLTELRTDNEKLEVVGFAKSASELIPILESSPVFRAVQFSSPITKRSADQEMFALKAEIEMVDIKDHAEKEKMGDRTPASNVKSGKQR
jgi:general secretion pathway protein L